MINSTTDLANAADQNLATHFTWVQRHTAGMRVQEDQGLVLTDCGLPCDTFNAVCHSRLTGADTVAQIERAIAWFGNRRHPFSWWVGPADTPSNLGNLLERAGLTAAEGELAMAVTLSELRPVALDPDGLEIRRVKSEAMLSQFAQLSAANWSPPDEMVIRFYQRAAPVLLAPECPLWFYLAYLNDEPVGTAELTVARNAVGLYNISTRPSHRRRGYGSVLTVFPLLEARAAGHHTAVLQASPDGVSVYRRVGFESFGQIVEYKPPILA